MLVKRICRLVVVQLKVYGIRLKADDELLTMQVADENADLLTVTEGGFAKRTQHHEYRRQNQSRFRRERS